MTYDGANVGFSDMLTALDGLYGSTSWYVPPVAGDFESFDSIEACDELGRMYTNDGGNYFNNVDQDDRLVGCQYDHNSSVVAWNSATSSSVAPSVDGLNVACLYAVRGPAVAK